MGPCLWSGPNKAPVCSLLVFDRFACGTRWWQVFEHTPAGHRVTVSQALSRCSVTVRMETPQPALVPEALVDPTALLALVCPSDAQHSDQERALWCQTCSGMEPSDTCLVLRPASRMLTCGWDPPESGHKALAVQVLSEAGPRVRGAGPPSCIGEPGLRVWPVALLYRGAGGTAKHTGAEWSGGTPKGPLPTWAWVGDRPGVA